ncbi:MAG: hypothetical protein KJN66_04765 [Bacteroidia bacterium]|nr:hypothetical protein [Bacteroidia bacterium]
MRFSIASTMDLDYRPPQIISMLHDIWKYLFVLTAKRLVNFGIWFDISL